MKITNTIAFTTALIAGVSAFAIPGGSHEIVSLKNNTIEVGPGRNKYCMGYDVYEISKRTLNEIRSNIKIRMNGESVSDRLGNYLLVTDKRGRNLNIGPNANIPYNTAGVKTLVSQTVDDICLSSTKHAKLDSIELSFESNHHVMPPPQSPTIVGQFVTLTELGDVMGWACDLKLRKNILVSAYINGVRQMSSSAGLSTDGQSDVMGRPDRDCGPLSGFQMRVPLDAYAGRNVVVEVRALNERLNQEVLIGTRTVLAPVMVLPRGLFQIGQDIFLSNGQKNYCHVVNPDQALILINQGQSSKNILKVSRLPLGMSSTGDCPVQVYPRGVFSAMKDNSAKTFFSDGAKYCEIQDPGQQEQIQTKNNLSSPVVYDQAPAAGTMEFTGTCKVRGFFKVSTDDNKDFIFFSNGESAFCIVKDLNQVSETVFTYTARPKNLRFDGFCN